MWVLGCGRTVLVYTFHIQHQVEIHSCFKLEFLFWCIAVGLWFLTVQFEHVSIGTLWWPHGCLVKVK